VQLNLPGGGCDGGAAFAPDGSNVNRIAASRIPAAIEPRDRIDFLDMEIASIDMTPPERSRFPVKITVH
jgi:hypothetical protein